MEDHQHLNPLLTSGTATTATAITITPASNEEICGTKLDSSNLIIIPRLVSVVLIGCISLWANHEANKGFHVTILNDSYDHSPAGRRFQLLYVSNDKATRLILEASQYVESLLYPTPSDSTFTFRKKQVNHVTLRLASQNLTQLVAVDSSAEGKFVINLSPSVMEETNIRGDMLRAVGLGMAQVWIFDNLHNAPRFLINGLVEYISSNLAPISAEVDPNLGSRNPGKICWNDENPKAIAHFLSYCEEQRKGFIRRLNQAMSETHIWHDRVMDDALDMPAQLLCSYYTSQQLLLSNSLQSSSDKIL